MGKTSYRGAATLRLVARKPHRNLDTVVAALQGAQWKPTKSIKDNPC